MPLRWLLPLLMSLPLLAEAGPAPLQLAWRGEQGNELLQLGASGVMARGPLPTNLQTPLGSLWKLFAFAYLEDTGQPERAYTCTGQDRDEVYCCDPGERIARDEALVKSCGLYFLPQRLGLDGALWRDYWHARGAPDWLADLGRLQPQTRVSVAELLDSLAHLPAQAEARAVLLDVTLNGSDGAAVAALGGRLRVKTWSWLADGDAQARQGGFAGWLADGSPVWLGGSGTSQSILKRHAELLGQVLPTSWPSEPGGCVEVNLFSRYPLRQLRTAEGRVAEPGRLQGRYEAEFENGNRLALESAGELVLSREQARWRLTARLSREEYVARVLDREASAQPEEAAKALAVAIRSYLQQQAERRGECLAIDDSSASQRVAPRPASPAARAIAAWTADLVLAGGPITYHLDTPGPSRLAWTEAVAQAGAGLRYDAILARAFPSASLSRWDNPVSACQALPEAEDWLRRQRRAWRERLDGEPGYFELPQFAVCRLAAGRPHVDRARQRIFVRGLHSLQDRLDLTHEYLHLAFEAHPNGQDEDYVEHLARQLLLE
ncbi:DUF2300 domain-containing protein [Pseudomonas indica]|uniref:DUF2300 domain-containing protein YfaQ n=1 Tax=Pseudomonas indica TaxID=137658 RepID=A0A1G9FJY5_9PSED|nr:DUF2300 domain-containing protein [Pseudomonas indica]PAU58582.1 hypothetical protein BZL42_12435 [Pseudomonas indica]SDK88689.1 DUF2300 domain-containing protein YfaQ [Pseudomonas indica]